MHTNVIGYTNPAVIHTYIIYKARGGKLFKNSNFIKGIKGERGIRGKALRAV